MAEKNEATEQMTISGVPRSLRVAIDEMAEAEDRQRSGQVVALLKEIVAAKRAAKKST